MLPEIGECVYCLHPNSVGKDKLDPRWENGIFVGFREESGEIFVMSKEGVIKVRSFNRRMEEERWNQEELNLGQGTPWEPAPGQGRIQIKSRLKIKDRKHLRALQQSNVEW